MKDYMFLFRFKAGFDEKKVSREEFQKEAAK